MSLTEGQKEWRTDAACKDYADRIDDPFFNDESDWNDRDTHNPGQELALALCRHCPVRRQCLDYEMDYERTHPGSAHGQFFGIWGGTTPQQRKRLRLMEREAS